MQRRTHPSSMRQPHAAAAALSILSCALVSECVKDLRAALLVSTKFARPSSHAPHASFQDAPAMPGDDFFVVAEQQDCFAHMAQAATCDVPLRDPWSREAEDLCAAVQLVASHMAAGTSAILMQTRSSTVQMLQAWRRRLAPIDKQLHSLSHPFVRPLSSRFSIALVFALINAMNWPDVDLATDMLLGFPLVGHIPPSMIHRPKQDPGSDDPDGDCVPMNAKLHASILKRGLSATPAELLDLTDTYAASIKEVESSYSWATGPFSLPDVRRLFPDGFCVFRRFPVRRYPDSPVRPCDDGKENGANARTHAQETIVCENSDFPTRVASMFYSLLGGSVEMRLGTDDLKKAYRQLPSAHPHLSGVVAQFNPHTKRVAYFVLRGMPFGLKGAVLQFNRLTKFMTAACRSLFASCCCSYYDDYCTVEPHLSAQSSQLCLLRLHEILGLLLDPEKHSRAAVANPFLGVVTDFSQFALGNVIVRVKPDRRENLLRALASVLEHRKLTRSMAATLHGKMYFVATTAFGRIGVAALAALNERAHHPRSKSKLTPALVSSLTFLLLLLSRLPPRVVQLRRAFRRALLVWSDASLEHGVGRLGFVAHDPEDNAVFYSACIVPSYIMHSFAHVHACICQLEILAALFAYLSMPSSRFANRHVLHWVDNTAAVTGLYKGSSSRADSAYLLCILSILRLRFAFRPFWEYVRSKANIADLPSRGIFGSLISMGAIWLTPVLPTEHEYRRSLHDWLPAMFKRSRQAPRAPGTPRRARLSQKRRRRSA